METRGPQSTQSVPKAHVANLEPGPPLSPALRQSFVYTMAEECGGGGGETLRAPQSVPYAYIGSTELGLPFGDATIEVTCTCDGCAQARGT